MSDSPTLDTFVSEVLDRLEGAEPPDRDAELSALRDAVTSDQGDLTAEAAALEPTLAARAARAFTAGGVGPDLLPAAELAMRAHEAGVDDAGPVFAEAADRLAVLSGRPQPFGTVVMMHNGELVQAPVDGGVDDEQRAQFGLPSLAIMRERIADQAAEHARSVAEAPTLPVDTPFARVWVDPDPAALRARWEAEGVAAWADGDVLTIVGDEPFVATPVFGMESWPVGDRSDLHALTVRVDRLDEAVITYTRQATTGSAAMADPTGRRGSHDGRFRGSNAPEELVSNDPLEGVLVEEIVESAALGEPRRVTVYKPPASAVDAAGGPPLPVVYATDGAMFGAYARRLDAAISAGWCPPVIVVAAHSAPMIPMPGAPANPRALEYLPGFDPATFDRHQRFFVDELTEFAEARLPIRTDRDGRAVFGCSDGGGPALATGMLHHARFGQVLAYSTGMAPDQHTRWVVEEGPFVHLCAGTLEGPFHQATAMWAFYLERIGAPHHFTERVCGHDLIQWAEELPRALVRAFG